MMKRQLIGIAIVLACANSAVADSAADIVKKQSDQFQAAAGSCDVPATLNLYEQNATLIWPGEGDVATGKPAIEKVLKGYCDGGSKLKMSQVSSQAKALGPDYIINVGMWDFTGSDGKTSRIRTTELLHKSGGKWRYAIDHASLGAPPPSTQATPQPK